MGSSIVLLFFYKNKKWRVLLMVSPFFHLAQCASVEKRDEMIISESAPRMHARCTPAAAQADVQGAGWTIRTHQLPPGAGRGHAIQS